MEVNVSRRFVKPFLFLFKILGCQKMLLVCKGYSEDYELFTELNWDEDKELDFNSDTQYQDFRIWL
jgi:hypothetical protein